MTLIRYDPVNTVRRLQEDLQTFFTHPFGGLMETLEEVRKGDWLPAVDVKRADAAYELKMDLPGLKPEDITIEYLNGVLTVKGKREAETKEEREGYIRTERHTGEFYRRFELPDADEPGIQADYADGVLKLTVPRIAEKEATVKRINVNAH